MRSIIGFDDFEIGRRGYVPISKPYHGLSWSNFSAYDAEIVHRRHGHGLLNGVVSGTQAAFNTTSGDAYLTLAGGTFDLKSVYLTSVYEQTGTVQVSGYKDGSEIYHVEVDIRRAKPTLAQLNFVGVDDVLFAGKDGNLATVFDDMEVKHVVPASQTMLSHPFGQDGSSAVLDAIPPHSPLDFAASTNHALV